MSNWAASASHFILTNEDFCIINEDLVNFEKDTWIRKNPDFFLPQ